MLIIYVTVYFCFGLKLAEHVGVDLTNTASFLLHCFDFALINGTGFFSSSKSVKRARLRISLYRGLFVVLQLRKRRHVLNIKKNYIVYYITYALNRIICGLLQYRFIFIYKFQYKLSKSM